jgi:hypothetical protein
MKVVLHVRGSSGQNFGQRHHRHAAEAAESHDRRLTSIASTVRGYFLGGVDHSINDE